MTEVTGGALGLGFETARLLAQECARVVMTDHDAVNEKAVLERIRSETDSGAILIELEVARSR